MKASVFRSLILPNYNSTPSEPIASASDAWERLAIQINQNKNSSLYVKSHPSSSIPRMPSLDSFQSSKDSFQSSSIMSATTTEPPLSASIEALEGLEMIPEFDIEELSTNHLAAITAYLDKAFQVVLRIKTAL